VEVVALMGINYCKCETTNGQLCRHCGKSYHFSFHHKSRRYTGDTHNRCWQALRRAKAKTILCDGHVEPWCECDSCGATASMRPPENLGYYARRNAEGWEEVAGFTGTKKLLLCPSCFGTFRVGLDWSLEKGGRGTLTESIACAFAFQLGQTLALNAPLHEMMRPDFVIAEHMTPGMPRWGSPMWPDLQRGQPQWSDAAGSWHDFDGREVPPEARQLRVVYRGNAFGPTS
jgi:hypothetical protein